MEATECCAEALFQKGYQLRIPIWQRRYAWAKPQWSELWDDIERALDGANHFVGSVVVIWQEGHKASKKRADRMIVVDGQQRIATLTVLIAALRDRMVAETSKSDEEAAKELFKEITLELLKTKGVEDEYKRRLVLQDADDTALASIVEKREVKLGALRDAYRFFTKAISNHSVDECQKLIDTIKTKLEVVWVSLSETDNAHRIFQTLNAGGRPLKQSDLVRNYFFLLLPGEQGEEFYEDSWSAMETLLKPVGLERFFAAWMQSRGQSGSVDSLFQQFQRDMKPLGDDTDQVLAYGKELVRASSIFHWMTEPSKCDSADLKVALRDFNIWDTKAAEGLLLQILIKHKSNFITSGENSESNELTAEQATKCFELVLSFFARRQLAGYQPNLHKSITRQYANELHASGEDGDDYVSELHVKLSSGNKVRRFPSDEEINELGTEVELYSRPRANWTFLILDRINRALYPKGPMAPTLDRSKFSVEHIMPQTLSEEWIEDMGKCGVEDITESHAEYLHTIGNLTLTPINSDLGQKRYEEKKPLLTAQGIPLNDGLNEHNIWRPDEILARSNTLITKALTVFTPPCQSEAATDSEDPLEGLEDDEGLEDAA